MVKVWPPMVSVPVLLDVVGFAVAANITVPPPVPLAPLLIDAHDTLLAAVHAHPAPVVTVMRPLPPPYPIACEVGEIEYVHAEGAAAWFTV